MCQFDKCKFLSIFLFKNIFVYADLRKDGTGVHAFFSLVLFGPFQQLCIFASLLTKKQKRNEKIDKLF